MHCALSSDPVNSISLFERVVFCRLAPTHAQTYAEFVREKAYEVSRQAGTEEEKRSSLSSVSPQYAFQEVMHSLQLISGQNCHRCGILSHLLFSFAEVDLWTIELLRRIAVPMLHDEKFMGVFGGMYEELGFGASIVPGLGSYFVVMGPGVWIFVE
ncbi:hypothetical protein EGR_10206 [Echinococcus granulosus]|uniref:Uncharacterized protein n=1 Tax=Echinococcus granulosus TaxID=6210 RepID=W6UN07_ECHGR|nr:hypothetical protein EGR_10206 [Echinococcus granulosus]EUB54924.1 hypothetical protein EGR_10206 [Echinococcus granulosus]